MKNPKHPHKRPSTDPANSGHNSNARNKEGVHGDGHYAAARGVIAAEEERERVQRAGLW